jgi:hypothetical protein
MIETSSSAYLTFTVAIITALITATNESRAIGPQEQVVNPTFDGVVRILYDKPGSQDAGDGYFNGSGSIIGNHNINGMGVLCVLTADHVLSTTGMFGGGLVTKPGIAFGNSNKVSGNSPYTQSLNVLRNGPTGTSDYAVMGVNYGAFNSDYNALVRNLITTSSFFEFSDIGYGNEGKLVDQFAPAGNDGYQRIDSYGTQRYLNDKIDTIATVASNFTAIGYTYTEAAIWYIDNPSDPMAHAGSGTTYDADSGSPYFATELDFDESKGISYFTNNQFAVHTGTNLANNPNAAPNGYKAFGVQNFGVALTAADVTWINQACDLVVVPEPCSLALVAVLLFIPLRLQRARNR